MRLDRDHLAIGADVTRQRQRIGADIGADIDEHAAGGRVRAQKIQLLDIVIGIEQRAALGGAGLMIEPERRALILHVDGPARSKLTSRDSIGRNAPRFSRERCASEMIAACAAFGANAPNGAGVGSLAGFKRGSSVTAEAAHA